MTIRASVGKGGVNDPADVQIVETLLAANRHWLDPLPALIPDGVCTPETIEAIRRFQATAAAIYKDDVDGLVSARGFTIRRLEAGYVPQPKHSVFAPMCWQRPASELTTRHYEAAAKALDCEVAAIQAVVEQEAGIRGPWDEMGRPTILFERHKFGGYSGHSWDKTHRDIASKSGSGGGGEQRDRYGSYAAQYPKLYRAATLDEDAALKSASWGSFQILGDKFAVCGFATVGEFVDAMLESQVRHLDLFVVYIKTQSKLKAALKARNWTSFALGYNGAGYKKNAYDTKMAAIYARLTKPVPRPFRSGG